jgi:uncharacterized protein with PQ loop repeat
MIFIDIAGWVGSVLFAICGLPQALHSFKVKNSHGLTWGFLGLWLGGEIFTLIYIMPKNDVAPLLLNYGLNLVFLSVICWYKIFPKPAQSHASSHPIKTAEADFVESPKGYP